MSCNTSNIITLSCVPIPLLFTQLTHNCTATHNTNHIIMFVANTTALALISNNDDSADADEPVAAQTTISQRQHN